MFVLGYTGRQRYGTASPQRKPSGLLNLALRHQSIFDSVTSFGPADTDMPLNFFPLDGVGHDASAALSVGTELVAAAAEERFNRIKNSTTLDGKTRLPDESIKYCLAKAGLSTKDIDHVAYYCDMSESIMAERTEIWQRVLSPGPLKERILRVEDEIFREVVSNDRIAEILKTQFEAFDREFHIHFVPHHIAHAASAFYTSGFGSSGIFTLDGSGEKSSSIFATGAADGIKTIEETLLPSSPGMLYMLITAFLGFKPLNGEFKVMGLSSVGSPKTYRRVFEELLPIAKDGTCAMPYLMREDFGPFIRDRLGEPRNREGELTARHMDIAAALQERFEHCVMQRLTYLKRRYGVTRMCFAGGCMLNSALNGKIARSGLFDDVHFFPGASDDGCSIGAALYAYHAISDLPAKPRRLRSISLGPSYNDREVKQALDRFKDQIYWSRPADLAGDAATALSNGEIIGWFQGPMEFGPRALGNRSILADPRHEDTKDRVNRVKHRESFRPFAPAVLAESAKDFFDLTGLQETPFMQFVVPAREKVFRDAQAIVHVDGSARLQTVNRSDNVPFWQLLKAFDRLTGVPILLNTSFNVRGEPIVCSPYDAVKCFLSTNIDLLVIENFLIFKKESK